MMTACYRVREMKPELFIFGRGSDLKRFVVKIKGFAPYFYAPAQEKDSRKTVESLEQVPVILDFKNRAVKRLNTEIPAQVKKLRRDYSFTDEADVEYEKRALTDLGIYCGFEIGQVGESQGVLPTDTHNIKPRVAIGDIEVLSPPEIMPKPTDARFPVVSIGFRDSYTGKSTLFLLENKARVFWRTSQYEEVIYCANEWSLFNSAADYCLDLQFDIWTGWFWKHYDVPYMYYRSPFINFDFRKFSPIHEVRIKPHPKKPRNYFVKIGGIETTDLLEQYRVLTKPEGQKLTWDLKFIVKGETVDKLVPAEFCRVCENTFCSHVSQQLTGVIKCQGFEYIDYGDAINIVHVSDHQKMIKYCFNDLIAAYLVDYVRGLTQHFDTARRLRGCFISDAHSAYQVHKSLLLRLTDKPLPTNFFGFTDRTYHVRGAFVKQPIPGLHENIGVLDVNNIYPVLIENYNASPETKSAEGTLCAPNGVCYKKSPLGLFPKAVKLLRKEREQYLAIRLSLTPGTPEWNLMWTKEQATKYDVRSFYGATRNVDPRVTDSITAGGRFILQQKLIPFVESLGYECIYGDTDSAHVRFKTADWQEGLLLEEAANKFLLKVSEELNFAEPLSLKFEEFFRRIFYQTKKRWSGFCTIRDKKPYNRLIIMGMAAKRSDSAKITVKTMEQFMLAVNLEGNVEKGVKILRDALAQFTTLPVTDIGIPKGLQKELEDYDHFLHAEAVKWSKKHLKIRFRQDKKPRLVYGYVKGKPFPALTKRKTRAFAIQDEKIEGLVIDYPAMIKKTLVDRFDPLLKALGLDWTAIVSKTRPSQLTKWCE